VQKVAIDGGWSFKGWLSESPHTLPDSFKTRWLTARLWEPGDFITFNMKMIHGSLDNHSDKIRISTDVRYQPGSEPADERWIGAEPPGHSTAGKKGRIC
jgi:ectoine hydroxylase-related dioxygenase (phytanoyl-CoA dioxygenase family)